VDNSKPIEKMWKAVEESAIPPNADRRTRAGMRDLFFFGAHALFNLLCKKLEDAENGKLTAEDISRLMEIISNELSGFFAEDENEALARANGKPH
jgi:hypothetical protein